MGEKFSFLMESYQKGASADIFDKVPTNGMLLSKNKRFLACVDENKYIRRRIKLYSVRAGENQTLAFLMILYEAAQTTASKRVWDAHLIISLIGGQPRFSFVLLLNISSRNLKYLEYNKARAFGPSTRRCISKLPDLFYASWRQSIFIFILHLPTLERSSILVFF